MLKPSTEEYGILGETSQKEIIQQFGNCRLCWVISHKGQRFPENHLLLETNDFVLVPALGAFMPGYSLFISKEHWGSAATLNENQVECLEFQLNHVLAVLRRTFSNKNWILFEHGTTVENGIKSCCIDHFHFHILPVEMNLTSEISRRTGTIPIEIGTLRDLVSMRLTEGTNYLLVSRGDDNYSLFTKNIYSSQYVRQLICLYMGLGADFKWQEFPRNEISLETISVFKSNKITKREIYFAHPIERLNQDVVAREVKNMRDKIEQRIRGIKLTSMFELLAEYRISQSDICKESYAKFLMETEKRYLQSCDLLLADLSLPDWQYVGVLMEIVYARCANIPVIIITGDSNIRERAWLRSHACSIVKDVDQAIPAIIDI